MADLVAGAVGVVLIVTLKDSAGVVVDLTGKTARLIWKMAGKGKATREMVIDQPPTLGKARYTFADGDLDASGALQFEVELSSSSPATVLVSQLYSLEVRARL